MRRPKVSPAILRPWPPVMRPPEAAEFVGLSPHTLAQLARDGKIPVVRFGRATAFLADDLVEYARRHREAPEGWEPSEPESVPTLEGRLP